MVTLESRRKLAGAFGDTTHSRSSRYADRVAFRCSRPQWVPVQTPLALRPFDEDPSSDEEASTREYKRFVAAGQMNSEWETIGTEVRRDQLTRDFRFRNEIEHELGRRISANTSARPRNSRSDNER